MIDQSNRAGKYINILPIHLPAWSFDILQSESKRNATNRVAAKKNGRRERTLVPWVKLHPFDGSFVQSKTSQNLDISSTFSHNLSLLMSI